ncbi:DUF5666 domain-containing protein [Nocardia australiensis]|uniref:DUF5666 domain-containing protein n=1 Tax=Nocardia australiensis TaxID=2887191 RepID=UPI001D147A67|nr:DUF5666 domain-containing protein [Nocardia australiensis]
MTNPNDPWARRPEDAPTEHLGTPGKSGFDQPADPTETYTYEPAPAYPSTEQMEPWPPPPVNATRELPPYDNQWGGYESTYGEQWADTTMPAGTGGGGVPPGPPGPVDQYPPPKRNTGLWVALVIGVVALIAVAGVVAGLLLGSKDSSSTSAASSATVTLPPAARETGTPKSGQSTATIPSLPGLGDIDGLGATMGTISANNGGTLTVDSLSGSAVTVHTDAQTQVISLSAAKATDLPVGDMIVIQGDKAADGSIQARIIISTSLPGGPR